MIGLLKYWKLSAGLALVAGFGVLVYQYGNRSYAAGVAAGVAQMQDKVAQAEETIARMEREAYELSAKRIAQMAQASREYQALKAAQEQKGKVQYVEVQKIVEKPVYRNVCISDDGLHELNRAVRGQ